MLLTEAVQIGSAQIVPQGLEKPSQPQIVGRFMANQTSVDFILFRRAKARWADRGAKTYRCTEEG